VTGAPALAADGPLRLPTSPKAEVSGVPTRSAPTQGAADRNLTRLLELLGAEPGGVVTIAAMRERGVQAPGQAVYALQVAGYAIARGYFVHEDGRRTLGYRLGDARPYVATRDGAGPERGRR
jgi:hypothetical protein